MFPVSAVLSSDEIMLTIGRGQHGSTFGGSPLACRVAKSALEVIVDERLSENAERLGRRFRERLGAVIPVRGRGLLNAIVIEPSPGRREVTVSAKAVCVELMQRGLLCKPTHENIIRFAPPLVINERQLDEATVGIELGRRPLALTLSLALRATRFARSPGHHRRRSVRTLELSLHALDSK